MVIRCGYLDPSLLIGAFPKEVHGHGVTLVPLWRTHVCRRKGASPPDLDDGGMLSWRRDNIGGGAWPAQLSTGST